MPVFVVKDVDALSDGFREVLGVVEFPIFDVRV